MNKFSDYEKRQILGSHEKLQDFMDGVESIFERDVLGYNGEMKRTFKDFGDSLKDTTEIKPKLCNRNLRVSNA